jgi:hypothetical protein
LKNLGSVQTIFLKTMWVPAWFWNINMCTSLWWWYFWHWNLQLFLRRVRQLTAQELWVIS